MDENNTSANSAGLQERKSHFIGFALAVTKYWNADGYDIFFILGGTTYMDQFCHILIITTLVTVCKKVKICRQLQTFSWIVLA